MWTLQLTLKFPPCHGNRLEALDPGERIVHTEMAWMRRITQTIDDPEIEAFQRAPALARNVADIGRIGRIADPVAECRDIAVLHDEGGKLHRAALPQDFLALAGLNPMSGQDRWIIAALGRDEAIGEPRHDVLRGRLIEIGRDAP